MESSTITSEMSEESINRVASPEIESSSAPHAQKKDSSSMQQSVSNMPSQQVSIQVVINIYPLSYSMHMHSSNFWLLK